MKKILKKYLTLIIFISTINGFSQNEAANWYFGNKSAINFLNDTPIVLSNSSMNTVEACSSISDSTGNLLFYSNGVNVWDKNHSIMPNGGGLLGFESTSQTVIVPKPKNEKFYYIFTIDDLSRDNGLNYSEINIDLNGGNGDVTDLKNVQISTKDMAEQISVVKHADGTSYWVVVREVNTNNFLAYEINEDGVSESSIISSLGAVLSNNWGYMKISPDGKKMALIGYTGSNENATGVVFLYDFNINNGTLTNFVKLYEFSNESPYGIEFSPDGSKLYASATRTLTDSRVYQFNLDVSDDEISESIEIVYQGTDGVFALQLAIDEKIYLANFNRNYLDVINRPNFIGSDCDYESRGINLLDGDSKYGLPTLVQSYLKPIIDVENFCLGSETVFNFSSNSNIASVNWDFGDGNTDSRINTTHTYNQEGKYEVNAIITSSNGEVKEITKEIEIFSLPNASITNDVVICSSESYNIGNKSAIILNGQLPENFKISYFENIENLENHIKELPLIETFYVENKTIYAKVYNALNRNCYVISEFEIITDFKPLIQANDYFVCYENFNESNFLNLEDLDIKVDGSQSNSSVMINYYNSLEDAENKENSIQANIEVSEISKTIYARVENADNPLCFEVAPINIQATFKPKPINISDFILCDDGLNDGKTFFDLKSKDNEIINNQSGNYNVTYHLSLEEANKGINNLPYSYENIDNPERIYSRIENINDNDCYSTNSFLIRVLNTPFFNIEETQYICEGETLNLDVPNNFDSYLWSTGEITNSITIDKPGKYFVTATLNYNLSLINTCDYTKEINVLDSGTASIEDIVIKDWSENNSLLVKVNGNGNYEFSLNNISFQETAFFENLEAGDYTLYIRDRNGCGTHQEQVLILSYPKYFTPNQDGYNDSWHINSELLGLGLKISIFNRYGKLVKELNSLSQGWDGTFNGNPMPESDYWFKVFVRERQKTYYGHFSLKR
ncbi:hypothetical protein DIS18_00840 [Algibacter marinivivus]|uniref:PKD domain-containing protein n=1 Tax=Algibacter marinivivus TaxID=2100723 RepID=A0A2U2X5V3_9FLAO|nr:T9SS type B sorting domain-containing protein [Algibacter marinivivus]PWH83132.1 hypothetical protein DIS18_00840 [Algibacter marinivivus]